MAGLLVMCPSSDWLEERGVEMGMRVEAKARELTGAGRFVCLPGSWPGSFSEEEQEQMDSMLVERVEALRDGGDVEDDIPF